MMKYFLLALLMPGISYAKNKKIAIPLPKESPSHQKINSYIINESFRYIAYREKFTASWKKGFGHKEMVIGYGDNICKTRYKNALKITKKQGDDCLNEIIEKIYRQLKKRTDNKLKPNQYVALISLIYNVGFDIVYKSRMFAMLPNIKNNALFEYEYLGFNKVDGKFSKGIYNRRKEELIIFSKICN